MNIFTRISATVERAVSSIENHDAVVEAALKETRAAAAKARVRLSRVYKDGENLRKKLVDLAEKEKLWTERAKTIAATDEAKALQCVGRRNQCKEQLIQTRDMLARHDELEQNIGQSVKRIEERLEELTNQRNMMRSRHSTVDAMRVINKIEDSSSVGIEDTFDRWEMLITESEYSVGSSHHSDSLDASFTQVENEDDLRADLALLLNETNIK